MLTPEQSSNMISEKYIILSFSKITYHILILLYTYHVRENKVKRIMPMHYMFQMFLLPEWEDMDRKYSEPVVWWLILVYIISSE